MRAHGVTALPRDTSDALKEKCFAEARTLAGRSGGERRKEVDRREVVVVSSWAKVDYCGVEFRLGLGKPEAVRRPRFEPIEGVVYFLPKGEHGEVVVGVCLREDDIEMLKKDKEFISLLEWVR